MIWPKPATSHAKRSPRVVITTSPQTAILDHPSTPLAPTLTRMKVTTDNVRSIAQKEPVSNRKSRSPTEGKEHDGGREKSGFLLTFSSTAQMEAISWHWLRDEACRSAS